MTQESQLKTDILSLLEREHVITGTENITLTITVRNSLPAVIKQMRALEAEGLVTIIRSHGGRGLRTVYKRNRNSPGTPRRRRR
jgi:hypothetical protein